MKPHDYLTHPKTTPGLHAFLQAALADLPPRDGLPALYATTARAFSGRSADGAVMMIKEHTRVRVTDVGRFGDVGITMQLDAPKSDQARATLAELTDFSSRM